MLYKASRLSTHSFQLKSNDECHRSGHRQWSQRAAELQIVRILPNTAWWRTDACYSRLRNSREIRLYIGQDTTPYIVSEALLRSISKCFATLIELQTPPEYEAHQRVLRVPSDDQTSWDMLLYWKFNGSMAPIPGDKDTQILQLIRSYSFGGRYILMQFQDLVMLELIRTVRMYAVNVEAVKLAFDVTPAGSPLRVLMAREALLSLCETSRIKPADLEVLKGVDGFHTEFGEAQILSYDGVNLHTKPQREESWKVFMVDGGPKQHWAYQNAGKPAQMEES